MVVVLKSWSLRLLLPFKSPTVVCNVTLLGSSFNMVIFFIDVL